MSTLMHRNEDDPNTPLYYAPRWLRERPVDLQSLENSLIREKPLGQETKQETTEAPLAPEAAEPAQKLHENSEMFEAAVRQALREALEPEVMPPPPVPRKKRKQGTVFGMLARWTAVAAITAVAATVVFVPFGEEAATPPKGRLDVKNSVGSINEMLDLGVRVSARTRGAIVVVKVLPPGAKLTAGIRMVSGEWRIPLDELAGVSVIPPADFRGQVNLNIKLHAADGSSVNSGSVRLAWTAADTIPTKIASLASPAIKVSTIPVRNSLSESAPSVELPRLQAEPAKPMVEPARQPVEPVRATIEPQRQPGEAVRQIDPAELAGLVKRAEDLLASGDILPARLLLMRAAEARHARAAHLLATTYDPAQLKRFGEHGAASDMALAQNWYQKAKDWGQAG